MHTVLTRLLYQLKAILPACKLHRAYEDSTHGLKVFCFQVHGLEEDVLGLFLQLFGEGQGGLCHSLKRLLEVEES